MIRDTSKRDYKERERERSNNTKNGDDDRGGRRGERRRGGEERRKNSNGEIMNGVSTRVFVYIKNKRVK